jgi:hypothetical protein
MSSNETEKNTYHNNINSDSDDEPIVIVSTSKKVYNKDKFHDNKLEEMVALDVRAISFF